jgi:hypothetical protein
VHERVFTWVLRQLAERGLVKGKRIGIDASTMEANAALRAIRRRDSSASYRAMLTRMAEASGVATPTAAELKQVDRERKGKRLSNAEWTSPSDPEARITRMQDGRTRLAYKPEHAVDLDTAAIVAAEIHAADRGRHHHSADSVRITTARPVMTSSSDRLWGDEPTRMIGPDVRPRKRERATRAHQGDLAHAGFPVLSDDHVIVENDVDRA